MKNVRVVLKRRPPGVPTANDFGVEQAPLPKIAEGEVLIETLFLSLDPYMGSAVKGRHMSGAIGEGDMMPGDTVGRVVQSRSSEFAEGDVVTARGGWQKYAVATARSPALSGMAAALAPVADRVEPLDGHPLSFYLGLLGTPGLTAYAGLVYALEPKPGQTLAVSAAAGAVGSAVGQIARNMGVRVVGIAGSDEKCAYVVDELGFAACVNRRANDWGSALKSACPDGIDRYFDTVGGSTLAMALRHLAMNARITLCGMMEQYNSETDLGGPSLGPIFGKRATLNSIVVYDYFDKLPVWRRLAVQWLDEGRLKTREDVAVGLDQAPAAFARLMAGENFGKAIVAVS